MVGERLASVVAANCRIQEDEARRNAEIEQSKQAKEIKELLFTTTSAPYIEARRSIGSCTCPSENLTSLRLQLERRTPTRASASDTVSRRPLASGRQRLLGATVGWPDSKFTRCTLSTVRLAAGHCAASRRTAAANVCRAHATASRTAAATRSADRCRRRQCDAHQHTRATVDDLADGADDDVDESSQTALFSRHFINKAARRRRAARSPASPTAAGQRASAKLGRSALAPQSKLPNARPSRAH